MYNNQNSAKSEYEEINFDKVVYVNRCTHTRTHKHTHIYTYIYTYYVYLCLIFQNVRIAYYKTNTN